MNSVGGENDYTRSGRFANRRQKSNCIRKNEYIFSFPAEKANCIRKFEYISLPGAKRGTLYTKIRIHSANWPKLRKLYSKNRIHSSGKGSAIAHAMPKHKKSPERTLARRGTPLSPLPQGSGTALRSDRDTLHADSSAHRDLLALRYSRDPAPRSNPHAEL
jgi:hypothetical protein